VHPQNKVSIIPIEKISDLKMSTPHTFIYSIKSFPSDLFDRLKAYKPKKIIRKNGTRIGVTGIISEQLRSKKPNPVLSYPFDESTKILQSINDFNTFIDSLENALSRNGDVMTRLVILGIEHLDRKVKAKFETLTKIYPLHIEIYSSKSEMDLTQKETEETIV